MYYKPSSYLSSKIKAYHICAFDFEMKMCFFELEAQTKQKNY